MRIYWWQCGLHIQPESMREVELLDQILEALKVLRFGKDSDSHMFSAIGR